MGLWTLFVAELRRRLLLIKRYPVQTGADVLSFYLIFLGLHLAISSMVRGVDPTAVSAVAAAQVVGFVAFYFAAMGLSVVENQLYTEMSHGTLEQVLLSPHGTLALVATRFLAALAIEAMFAVPLAFLLTLTTGTRIAVTPLMLGVLVLIMGGVFGLALLLGGLTLLFKRVGQLPFIFQILFLGLGMSSVGNLPEPLQRISLALPFARGVGLLQDLATGQLRGGWLGWQEVLPLLVNTVAYLITGCAFFVWAERMAKDRGLLARY